MIKAQQYQALELGTAEIAIGHYYLERGYWMDNGNPDLERPVERHYIVDYSGNHREIAKSTLINAK